MSSLFQSVLLLAQDAAPEVAEKPWYDSALGILGLLILVIVIPLVLAHFTAKWLRMKDYSWKLFILFGTALAGVVITVFGWPPKLGIDLKGGTILIYEIDQAQLGDKQVDMDQLIGSVRERIDPSGVKQVVVQQYGEQQVEFVIPEVDQEEVENIKRIVAATGALEFRILASTLYQQEDGALIERALEAPGNVIKDPNRLAQRDDERIRAVVAEAEQLPPTQSAIERDGEPLARWIPIPEEDRQRIQNNSNYVTRTGVDGEPQVLEAVGRRLAEWVDVGLNDEGEPRVLPQRVNIARDRNGRMQILVKIDQLNVTGKYLEAARAGRDPQTGQPIVSFSFDSAGANRFGTLTANNAPQPATGNVRQLAIILDGQLLSAPNLNAIIRDRGQISGDFSDEDVEWLVNVLDAGSLPAALTEQPISEQSLSATLGQDTIDSGVRAIVVSFFAVLFFMPLYYRFAGLVAAMALTLNLLLVVALMITISATFTLPGLAALVLTVGMSVDANVLIFERIREETNRGAALRMAIRNGFDRATRTIVDANVTTLIVATVLWLIGNDQIKGFAVTLWLGILLSMFTAIFCSRIVFDIAERRRWITQLGMFRLVGETHIDFLGKKLACMFGSLLLIAIGLAAVFSRGVDLLDIEFTGGTAAQVTFVEPQQTELVRTKLGQYETDLPDLRVYALGGEDLEYRVETTNLELEQVRDRISSTFGDQLRRNHLTFDMAAAQPISRESLIEAGGGTQAESPVDPAPTTGPEGIEGEPGEEGTPGETPTEQPAEESEQPADSDEPATDEPADPAPVDPAPTDPAPADPAPISEQPVADEPATNGSTDPETTPEQPGSEEPIVDETVVEPAGDGSEEEGETETPVEFEELIGGTRVELKFDERIDQTSVSRRVDEAMQSLGFAAPFRVSRPDVAAGSRLKSNEWTLEIALSTEQTERLLTQMAEQVEAEPVFAALNNIGSQVAGDAKRQAIIALTFSLLSIVAYIWFRFQRVAFGLAAVVALVHDVAIMLGILALCGYLVQYAPPVAGLLLIEDFKISLTILAGFLTVIGYSLNDTIVVFDRIREVRGKSPDLTETMINDSVNQTLSRTLLTSFTTFIVVFILYLIGGPGIHGFAFSLCVGVVVGTYSSIYIASPALLFMAGRGGKPSEVDRLAQKTEAVKSP